MARWLEILAEYNMDIKHRPGKQHTNADALPRSVHECRQCAKPKQEAALSIKADSPASVQSEDSLD